MGIYENFAYFYSKGDYTLYSEVMLEILPSVLEQFNITPKSILDLACGVGTFSIGATKIGYQVTGVDRSKYMLNIAIENAKKDGLDINFLEQDIRFLYLKDKFDLAVCWYDRLKLYPNNAGFRKSLFWCIKKP
jgi:2-polyprenyl-3-methyl-5-hydroxy-6-metoxy-1,4-benzoquinol methylase